ncbi:MAG: cohesin domain-containing protein [Anaerolineae bacterium]|nr:cohesin domain-containing protein [Anaerolineae bacterium]
MGGTAARRPWRSINSIRARLRLLALLTVTALAVLGGASPRQAGAALPAAPGAATLQVVPLQATVFVGETTTVEVRVSDVQPLAGIALRLHFDASRLQVVESAPGVTIASGPFFTPTHVQVCQIDNTTGLIAYEAARSSPPYPSGAGTLIRVSFQAVQAGEAQVGFHDQDTALVSADHLVLERALVDASVSIQPTLACGEALGNPSFESGSFTPWRTGGGTLLYTAICHTGTYSAWLGGYDEPHVGENDSLWQALTLGSDAVRAEFRYWYWAHCDDPDCSVDTLRVQLLDQGGNLLQALDAHSGAEADSAWHASPLVDLAAYAGQTVQVHFELEGPGITHFMVDDVSVFVCPPPSEPPPAAYRVYLPLVLRSP